MPEEKLPSTQECFDILKRAEENRKKCCDRLIELKMLKDDAWNSGNLTKFGMTGMKVRRKVNMEEEIENNLNTDYIFLFGGKNGNR